MDLSLFSLEGKTALVTGVSRGLGQAMAIALARAGADIVGVGLRGMGDTQALAEAEGRRTYEIRADLSQRNAAERVAKEALAAFGKVDILVNNAGIAWFGLLTDMTDEDWSSLLQTNLSSVFYCCRAAIPHMVSVKCGRIINISSMWGTAGASCEAAYSATKSGIHGLTKALAKELAPSHIQVNAIACGAIDTSMNGHLSKEELDELACEIPAGTLGKPEGVARLVKLMLESDDYLTGQVIQYDGGWI